MKVQTSGGGFPRRARPAGHCRGRPRRCPRGFTLIEMLTVVAALIILLGLMVSLAWDVRRQSSERLTKELLVKLDRLMAQYVQQHKRLPHVLPLVDPGLTGGPAPQSQPAPLSSTRPAEDELPDEGTLHAAAELNNRDFVLALRAESSGRTPELFGPVGGAMYDEVTLRDAWGTPIVFMPEMHPAIGMALGNRPFFVSAGPDRRFRTLEDNLYSYEQAVPEAAEGAATP